MLNNKSILAIIPARGGSKGVPGKNLRKMANGQSLLAHTIQTAKLSKFIDKIIVSSEDQEILQTAHKVCADTPFVRPCELAKDETSSAEVILHALSKLPHYDYVVVLQVTSPLRIVNDIDACLNLCIKNNAKACVSVSKASENPYWMFSMDGSAKLLPLFAKAVPTQRQACPDVYALNGAIYVAFTDWFKKNKTFLSFDTLAYEMPKERSLDIDTEFDFKLLDFYLSEKPVYAE